MTPERRLSNSRVLLLCCGLAEALEIDEDLERIMAHTIEIICPCCDERLVVEVDTHRAWKASAESTAKKSQKNSKSKNGGQAKVDASDAFDAALESVRQSTENVEDKFRQALDQESSKDEKLDEAFRKAKKEAEKNPRKRPHNPLDWD